MLDSFCRRGLMTTWHWLSRDQIDLNRFSHELANAARKTIRSEGEAWIGSSLGKLGRDSLLELEP